MSKVFSAKRKTAEFDYEFLDGIKTSLVVRSLSTKEQMKNSDIDIEDGESIIKKFKELVMIQLGNNDEKIVKKVINEQFEDGDIIVFSNEIASLIEEEKTKK